LGSFFQLDDIHSNLFWGNNDQFFKKLDEVIKKEGFLGGKNHPNAADFLAYSAAGTKVGSGLQEWIKKCKAVFG
jgi:hypothetical protein